MAFLPAVLVAAGIAILSLWENPQMPDAVTVNDKLAHTLMYAVLALALMGAFVSIRRTTLAVYVSVWLFATGYGALIEVLQRFCTLSRSCEVADLCADSLGALIGILCVFIFTILRKNNS
ncbi:MAG: VanZ family protein [Paludibacteraceae bacterium]|nr:VanZ family protein [Paludibacteraceae bacterium]MBR0065742.1 VanZ family protein [Paludibacteraceae bacterium]